jgi:Rad3-related DNA helicase
MSDPLDVFSPDTRAWFEGAFAGPTPAQQLGWPAIARGGNTLIQAPTGSGKTLRRSCTGSTGSRTTQAQAFACSTSRR